MAGVIVESEVVTVVRLGVDVSVRCAGCEKELAVLSTQVSGDDISVRVEACGTCRPQAYADGHASGFTEAQESAI